jgi:hypothetical protein
MFLFLLIYLRFLKTLNAQVLRGKDFLSPVIQIKEGQVGGKHITKTEIST